MGKFEMIEDDKIIVHKVKGHSNTVTKDNFIKVVRDQNLAITRSKNLFSQTRKGIYPSIVDDFYKERVKVRKKMARLKRKLSKLDKSDDEKVKLLEEDISRLHTRQFTIKIFINTVYGYFGNKHAPMGDPDISRSITLTGQAIIKESNKILTEYVKLRCNLTDEDLERNPVIIYNDTDSVYITIKHLTEHLGIRFADDNLRITKECKQLTQDIEDHLNIEIVKWGKSALNSTDCRFKFKRESICDVGLFLQKKRYILRVLDDEDIPVNKFKYTGVEVVRTTMPKPIKPHVKKIIETMLMTKDYDKTNKLLHETYDIFKSLPLEDVAFVMGVSQYKTSNGVDKCEGFRTYKGMPIHLKGAYYYNLLLDRLDITDKYETISSGDKVRYFYVQQPNQYGIKTFAYKYYFPEELQDSLVLDYELMFDKIVYSVIERVYDAVNWKPRRPGEIVKTCLFDLFQE
jgi:DNA polymerase elongation subunit (family B)